MKTKKTEEEIAALRAEWRKQHPEEAARRALKKKVKNDVGYYEFDQLLINIGPSVESMSEEDLAESKKEMATLWCAMYQRCQNYLKSGDLKEAELTQDEKRKFKEFILRFEGAEGFVTEVENLLIEGLKYPEEDHEVATFCFNYLDAKYRSGKEPSLTLWLGIWNRSYVPLDVVRLMMRNNPEKGTYNKRECFAGIWPLLREKVLQHRTQEERLFAEANRTDVKNAGQFARRYAFLDILYYVFERK